MSTEQRRDVREVREEQGFRIRKIDDIGEHVGGARKDIAREGRINLSIYEQMTHKEKQELLTRENIWPRPDWRALTRSEQPEGVVPMEPEAAAYIDAVRVNITKAFEDLPYDKRVPTEEIAQDTYMKGLNWLAENYQNYRTRAGCEKLREDFYSFMEMPDIRDRVLGETRNPDILLQQKEQVERQAIFIKQAKNARIMKTDPFSPANTQVREQRAKVRPYATNGNFPESMSNWEIVPSFGGTFNLLYINRNFEMDIPQKRGHLLFGAKDAPGNYQENAHQNGFKSIDEAVAWAEKNTNKIVSDVGLSNKTGQRGQYRLRRLNLEDIHRNGPPVRVLGEINEDRLKRDFGLRGVEFGEGLSLKARRALVFHTYQAFSDLADALEIRKVDIGLNNTLALGLASRGKGVAAAHYEAARTVINLTKLKGAGSLAHEFGHAFEHYMTKNLFPAHEHKNTYLSRSIQPSTTAEELKQPYKGKIRLNKNHQNKAIDRYLELRDAIFFAKKGSEPYQKAVDYMVEKGFPENSKETAEYASHQRSDYIDAIKKSRTINPKHINEYYLDGPEIFARMFETYISDKLEGMGRRSDFLVNSVGSLDAAHPRKTTIGFDPYPWGNDRKEIFKAMDAVISPQLVLEKTRRREEDKKLRRQERESQKVAAAQIQKFRELEAKLALEKKQEKTSENVKEQKGPAGQNSFDF